MQEQELHYYEEEGDEAKEVAIQEVLSCMQEAYCSSGGQGLGPVAQVAERRTPNPKAGGSNPPGPVYYEVG